VETFRTFLERVTTPAISVTQEGNNVSIVAHLDIWGTGADSNADRTGAAYTPYRELVMDGIRHHWERDRGGLNVEVTIIQLNESTQILRDQGQRFLSIQIVDGVGIANNNVAVEVIDGVPIWDSWSIMNTGEITIFTSGSNGRYSADQIMYIAGHEFGHAMGVGDGFGYGYGNSRNGHISSIMTSSVQSPHTATRIDVELAIRAFDNNAHQRWADNSELIEAHRRRNR